MNCSSCNAPLEEGAKFCGVCGAKVEQEAPQQAAKPVKPRKPLDKKMLTIIGAAAAAVVVIIVALVIILNLNKKIDLADYTKVTFDGYNTAGKAEIVFDQEKFMEDLEDKAKGLKDASDYDSIDDLLDSVKDLSGYQDFMNVEYKLDKDSDLKNGDVVKVKFTFNNDAADEYGITYVGDEMEFTVSGLGEIKELDPFANVTIEYEGTSPNATANLVNNATDEALKDLYFEIENNGNLAKGATFTVSVDYDEEGFMDQYGAKLTTTSKQFTVDNVDTYITTTSEIPADLLTSVKNQAKDVIDAYAATNKDSFKTSGVSYSGCYFLTEKSTDGYHDHNVLYVVYKGTVKSKDKSFKKSTVYFPVKFTNLTLYADGTGYVDLNVNSITGSSGLSYGWFGNVSGYTKVATMKNELVTAEKGTYNEEAIDEIK